MLVDAGPLVAILDRKDADHARCRDCLSSRPNLPMITTWACLAEASRILGRNVGLFGQVALLSMIRDGDLQLCNLTFAECERCIFRPRQAIHSGGK